MLAYTLLGSLVLAGYVQTALALSTIHLFQASLIPNVNTTLAEFVAAEANYEGYAALTCTTWNPPGFSALGGSSIDSGYKQFAYIDASPHTGNVIGGFWLQDATPNLLLYGTFAIPINMTQNGNIAPVEIVLNFGS